MLDAVMTDADAVGLEGGQRAGPAPSRRSVVLGWLAAAPLTPVAVGLAAGIAVDAAWAMPFWMAAVLLVAGGGVLWLGRRVEGLGHVALLVAGVGVGAGLYDTQFRRWPADQLVRYCGDEPTAARVTGVAVQTPLVQTPRCGRIQWIPQEPHSRLLVEAERLEGINGPIAVSGLVAVTVREALTGVRAGDRVELFGTMYRPAPPDNPGERDWPLIDRRNGVLVEMSCAHAANVTLVDVGSRYARWLGGVRRWACAAMREEAFADGAPGARLLEALVLGQRSAVDAELNQAFVNTGTVHYLSVSGAHVGVLVAFVWGVGWMLGRTRRQCAVLAMVLVVAYAVLTEPSPAITRSAIMAVVFCLAGLGRRPMSVANALAASAAIILVSAPTQLFDPGFQLSFGALLALMYLGPRILGAWKWSTDKLLRRDDPLLQPEIQRMLKRHQRLYLEEKPSRWVEYWEALPVYAGVLWKAVFWSLAAWAVGGLLSWYHFRQVPVWGWLNSVIVAIPMSAVLLLGLIKTVLSGAGVPTPGLGWLLERMTDGLIGVIHALDRLPGSGCSVPEISGWTVAAGLAALGFWVVTGTLRIRRRWVVVAMAALAVVMGWNFRPRGAMDGLKLNMLAVGNGTACVMQMPDGQVMIYDLGSRPPYDMQRWTVGPFLAHEHIRAIDVLAMSHPEMDHFSGVPDLLDKVKVSELLTSPRFKRPRRADTPAEQLLEDLGRRRDLKWRTALRGERITAGAAVVEVLWPPGDAELDIRDENNASMVWRISYAGRRILLCGDIAEAAERHLMLAEDIGADVLVLPHHGSVVRTTGEFIRAVNPKWVIRSSGQRDAETRNGLLELVKGREYFSTAERGEVEVSILEGEMMVRGFR